MKTENMTIYLNTFERSKVLEVFMQIAVKNIPDLIICNNIGKEDQRIILSYHPYLNRLDLTCFYSEYVFSNPDYTGLISSKNDFLKKIIPSESYYKIIE